MSDETAECRFLFGIELMNLANWHHEVHLVMDNVNFRALMQNALPTTAKGWIDIDRKLAVEYVAAMKKDNGPSFNVWGVLFPYGGGIDALVMSVDLPRAETTTPSEENHV